MNQRANFQRLKIIGVVVARAQCVVANHNSALDFLAEFFRARVRHHFHNVRAVDAGTVADAVIAFKIRGGFGGRNQIVSRNGVFGVRQTQFYNLRAELFKFFRDIADGGLNLRVDTFNEIFFGQTDF